MLSMKKRWKIRRRAVFATLLYCALILVYLLIMGDGESMVHESTASSIFILAAVTIGGYVFGNVMDPGDDPDSDTMEDNALGTWENRRKVIFVTIAICILGTSYLLHFGEDTSLNKTLSDGFCLLYGSVLSAYVFGATWDDNRLKERFTE